MSALLSTSAALSRHFSFEDESGGEVYSAQPTFVPPTGAEIFGEAKPPRRVILAERGAFFSGAFQDARLANVTAASRLAVRPAPDMMTSGIAEIDMLTGGLPRGCLTEICGTASSGRSTLMMAALAAAAGRGEFCAVVDASDALDPQSMAAAGVELERLLWVRCGDSAQRYRGPENDRNFKKMDETRMEQLMRATDLLLESGGFGLIVLDMGDLPPQSARRIPMATWFRFRRAVENTPTVLLVIERQSIAGSCSSLLIHLSIKVDGMHCQVGVPSHAQLLTEMPIVAELSRSRMERKPVCPAGIEFAGKTAWAG